MEEKTYCCLSFPHTFDEEKLQGFMARFNPLGYRDDDAVWQCYFATADWQSGLREECLTALNALFPDRSVKEDILIMKNWNEEWEKSILPLRVSDRFIIAPSWAYVEPASDEIVLIIDPKMSFGTGYHATTRLMIRSMESCHLMDKATLDVGTGTGILAIAAIQLGAKTAVGVDTDEWSVDNAMENLQRNRPDAAVTFFHGSIEKSPGMFDVIFSNITKNDNLSLLPEFRGRLRTDGVIILSGFLVEDLDEMVDGLHRNGFELLQTRTEDEWIALTAQAV
jgi:ribosomal protein L11 methyltransferase